MATVNHHLFLLFLLSLTILAHGKLSLHLSDLKAFQVVAKDLGLAGQRQALLRPCAFPGVSCERRRISDGSYVLTITRLVFESRQLCGFISPGIGDLPELRELSLPNNHLVDRIPTEIVNCRRLEVLNLRSNRLSGDVPSGVSSLIRLRSLDFSSNNLSGDLEFLKRLRNLENLSLGDNSFTGRLPTSLKKSFPNLKFLNVSGHPFLEDDTVLYLPKRRLLVETKPKASNRSNSNATGAPPPTAEHHKYKKGGRMVKVWIIGFFAGAGAGCASGLIFSVIAKLLMAVIRGRVKDSGPVIFSPLIKKKQDLAFLEKDEGLSSLEIIGKGGCGQVYKAELPGSDGKLIAIKKIVQPAKDGKLAAAELSDEDSKLLDKKMRQIRSEIQTVGQIRHRNLLPLLAHVPRPDCHYLVYEFMKNGSLQDMLVRVSNGSAELDWPARHRIAMGVASGLEYLHMNHSQRIIHRDLKPANVLLDDEMEARIADFGLAKTIPEAVTHVTTSNVAGTVGYIAPEYHQTLKFTDKCDIYSFGVLLGVLVMGKMPSDEFFQHTSEMSLVKWLRNVMVSEDPRRAIDRRLIGNGKEEEEMLLLLKIATFCTVDDPKQRPNSKDVRCMLSQIKP